MTSSKCKPALGPAGECTERASYAGAGVWGERKWELSQRVGPEPELQGPSKGANLWKGERLFSLGGVMMSKCHLFCKALLMTSPTPTEE